MCNVPSKNGPGTEKVNILFFAEHDFITEIWQAEHRAGSLYDVSTVYTRAHSHMRVKSDVTHSTVTDENVCPAPW